MFTLRSKEGKVLLRRDGSPFTYSTRELARLGKRILDADRKESFQIVASK